MSDNPRYAVFRDSDGFEYSKANDEITVYYEDHFGSAVFVCP